LIASAERIAVENKGLEAEERRMAVIGRFLRI